MTRRRTLLVLAGASFALGALCWLWGELDAPGRAFVRGHLGDVAAIAFVYALLGLAWRGPIAARAAITAIIGVAIELAQRRGDPGGGVAGEILLGHRFDPWDLLAYAVGLITAVTWEGRIRDT